MSLRVQLLLFGVLTFAFPWAGLRFVQEMEGALRNGLESALLASAGTVAAALSNQPEVRATAASREPSEPVQTLYAHRLKAAPRIDGFSGDWVLEPRFRLELDADHAIWLGIDDRFVYVFVETRDRDVIYQASPGESLYGDRIVLLLRTEAGGERALLLSTAAPGVFPARETKPPIFVPGEGFEGRVLAAWQETADGFAVEARLPLGLTRDGLGVGIIDSDRAAQGYSVALLATWDTQTPAASTLVYERPGIRRLVEQFTRSGDRFRVLDRNGWVIADTGTVDEAALASAEPDAGFAEGFFRFVLRREDPSYELLETPPGRLADDGLRVALAGKQATAWYRAGPSTAAIVVAAVPIEASANVIGAVLLEQASDSILTLTNRTLMRLMSVALAISLVAALALLGYATLLSIRLRRLAMAAETALGSKGEINVSVPGRAAKDELGDLARSFSDLLGRLRDYTEYLRTLSSKLTHELRTPLAIVTTSLDNLEDEKRAESADVYIARLRDGAGRLDSILAAMGAATKMEQAIAETVAEEFDLGAVLGACVQAYEDIYPQRRFICGVTGGPWPVKGSSELFAQMLDKLVENAVSFSSADSVIELDLSAAPREYALSIRNKGELLPESMRHQLFDSLVSVRKRADDRPHLGLGLYIVALIADYHAARVEADNLPDASGVVIRIVFPRLEGRRQPIAKQAPVPPRPQ